jgi:hypothetical protein
VCIGTTASKQFAATSVTSITYNLANFLAGPQQGKFLWFSEWRGFLWVLLLGDSLLEHTKHLYLWDRFAGKMPANDIQYIFFTRYHVLERMKEEQGLLIWQKKNHGCSRD